MAIKPKIMSLRFPGMGVVRRYSQERNYSATDYPTPHAVNVRLEDSLTNRLRGGSFDAISAEAKDDPVYRDRAVDIDDAVIRVSRVGSHADFDFDSDASDMLRPTLFTLSEGGGTGSDVVTVVPHKDSYMLCFTSGETWLMAGDPLTGSLRNISTECGIIAEGAWCKNHDTIYFLSSHGLYSVSADGSGLRPLSEDKIPEDLTGITDSGCTLTYNHADRGVYIHKSSGLSWFYDTERDQFWPFSSSSQSHLLIGPLRIGGPNQLGMIQNIVGIMANGGGTVTWRIVPGETAEDAAYNGKTAIAASLAGIAFDEYVAGYGSWESGRSNYSYPRVRCSWMVLWLSSTETWAFESVNLETIPFGRHR